MGDSKLKQQRSLIHGLPDELVADEILPRASKSSWWDTRSLRAVSAGWRGAVEENPHHQMFAVIHRLQDDDNRSSYRFAVSIYDPQRCTWTQMPPIPGILGGAPMSARCICVDGRLYVIGGRCLPSLDFLRSVYCLDIRSVRPSWTRLADMACARSCMTWRGNVVVAGGQSDHGQMAIADVEMYDARRDKWSSLPPLLLPRADCTGAVAGDSLCVVGGFTWEGRGDPRLDAAALVDSMEVLDNDMENWRHVIAAGDVREMLRSCVVASSTLQRVHVSTFRKTLRRCDSSRWMSVSGRISASSSTAGDADSGMSSDEEDDGVIVLLAVGGASGDEYATKCDLQRGNVTTSLCRKAKKGRLGSLWHEIPLPFDVIPTVPCCSISI